MGELKKQRQRIRELMQYAVPDAELAAALDLLVLFRNDRIALSVLEEFYSYLPDAQDDWVKELRLVARRQGVFLLAAVTARDSYLYLVSSEGIEFHGSLLEGYLDVQLLDFFGFADEETFQDSAEKPENFPPYQAMQVDVDICPACHAAIGEVHELGCPVEVCPWCGGQLVHCSCRFEQLGVDAIVDEQELDQFAALLEQKGRISFSPEQRPNFADEGPGIEQQ